MWALQLQQPPELLTHFKKERERERAGLKKLTEESLPVESGRSKNQQERGGRKPTNFSSDWILRFWGKEKAPLSVLSPSLRRAAAAAAGGRYVPAWPDPPPPWRPRSRRWGAALRPRRAEPCTDGGPQAQAAVDGRPPRAFRRRRGPARRTREWATPLLPCSPISLLCFGIGVESNAWLLVSASIGCPPWSWAGEISWRARGSGAGNAQDWGCLRWNYWKVLIISVEILEFRFELSASRLDKCTVHLRSDLACPRQDGIAGVHEWILPAFLLWTMLTYMAWISADGSFCWSRSVFVFGWPVLMKFDCWGQCYEVG